MTTWPKLFATALFGASIATACVVTTDDDDDDDITDDTDGESGRAGATSGRSGVGGTRSGAGGGGAGGTRAGAGGGGRGGSTAGTGGSTPPSELDCSDPEGTPAATCEFNIPANAPDNQAKCFECLSGACCTEIKNCYATGPENLCGYGGPVGGSEFECFRLCLVEQAELRSDTTYTPEDTDFCAVECSTPRDKNGESCDIIGNQTNALYNCMADNCDAECVTDLITP